MWTRVNIMRYLIAIGRELPGSWKQKRPLLEKIKSCVQDYVSDGATVSYKRLQERFGSPTEIATAYAQEMESLELIKALHIKKNILHIFLICVFIALILWIALLATSFLSFKKDMNGYNVVEVIEISRN